MTRTAASRSVLILPAESSSQNRWGWLRRKAADSWETWRSLPGGELDDQASDQAKHSSDPSAHRRGDQRQHHAAIFTEGLRGRAKCLRSVSKSIGLPVSGFLISK